MVVVEGFGVEELEAWAPSPPDYAHWRTRLLAKKPYIADSEEGILGFIELEADGHIDCFYVHRDHQRKGVGQRFYSHLLEQTEIRGIGDLYVEASKIARHFFERAGFEFVRTNHIERGSETLINYSMRRVRTQR
jgi:putative acetyltransferase